MTVNKLTLPILFLLIFFGTIGVADEMLIYGDLYVAGSIDRLSQAVKQPAVQR